MILNSPTISGSLTVTGNIIASGSITLSGSIASASFASTASFVALAQSASNAVSAQTASFANAFTVAGNLTAQTLVVQTITSSVDFVTGSTRFGSLLSNTHVFSGSVTMNPGGLFVSSSGNVGIGTVSPSQLLEVVGGEIKAGRVDSSNEGGQVSFGRSTDNATAWYIDAFGNVASPQLRFLNVTDSVITMAFTGSRVGIGTSSPNDLLEVRGGFIRLSATSGNGPQFNLYSNGQTSNHVTLAQGFALATDNIGYLYNRANADFVFGTNNTERMRITNGGNIIVGYNQTTSNTIGRTFATTHASGNRGASLFYGINDGSNGGMFVYNVASSNPSFNSQYVTFETHEGGVSAGERMRITSGGNLLFTGGVSTGVTDTKFLMISQGTTSSTFAMVIKQSNNSTNLFALRDDGVFFTGTAAASPYNNTYGNAANVYIGSDGAMGRSTSSIKYKENVLDYNKGLAEVMQLRPVSYTSKNQQEEGQTFAGLIAEEVHDLGLTEFVQYAEDGTPDALAYQNMVALLTKSIQELKAQNDDLQSQINELKAQ